MWPRLAANRIVASVGSDDASYTTPAEFEASHYRHTVAANPAATQEIEPPVTFRIEHPDHMTVAVTDVQAAIGFFALLGFREDHAVTIDGGVPAMYMGMPSMRADHITLVLDREPRFEIQLLRFADAGDEDGTDGFDDVISTNRCRRGFNHLALRVDDLVTAAAELRANGVRSLNEAMTFIGRRLQFFEGPDGVTIELVEWLDDPISP